MTNEKGHLLIGTERTNGTMKTWIVPATYSGKGLALHKDIVNGREDRWTVTHVSSGLMLRGGLKRREAQKLFDALRDEDWSFAKEHVTADHARRVREILEGA